MAKKQRKTTWEKQYKRLEPYEDVVLGSDNRWWWVLDITQVKSSLHLYVASFGDGTGGFMYGDPHEWVTVWCWREDLAPDEIAKHERGKAKALKEKG